MSRSPRSPLPAAIASRPKTGFGVPMARWLSHPIGGGADRRAERQAAREIVGTSLGDHRDGRCHVMRVIHVVPSVSRGSERAIVFRAPVVRVAVERLAKKSLWRHWICHQSRLAPDFLRLFPLSPGPQRLGRSQKMYRWLSAEVASGRVDVMHNHGMWQMNALYPGWSVRGSRSTFVVSPRGSLSAWAMSHGSRAKRLVWPLLQRPALSAATCFHATAESEYGDVRRMGFAQPVAIIPNGVDVPELRSTCERESREHCSSSGESIPRRASTSSSTPGPRSWTVFQTGDSGSSATIDIWPIARLLPEHQGARSSDCG